MMKLLDTLHRWTGGLIGLVLALMGLSGTILLYEHLWIGFPGTGDPLRGDLTTVAATTEKLMATPGAQRIIYADARFGLHQLRSEEHTSELQSLMRISYAVFCLKKKNKSTITEHVL